MTSHLNLVQAFQIAEEAELVAFTGGGGKSALLVALAHQLANGVLLTTTTRMFAAQVEAAATSLPAEIYTYPNLPAPGAAMQKTILTGPQKGDKVTGVPLDLPAKLLAWPEIATVVVEADGAKMLPIKAPAAHEPALPEGVTLVVPVAGMDALGGRIDVVAHRPERVAQLLSKRLTDRLTAEDIVSLLSRESGGLKDVPETARVIPAINKVETPEQLAAARQIAQGLLRRSRSQQVLLSSSKAAGSVVEVQRRVTAVVLAAGESSRMGRSKQLLPWRETTLLGQTLRNLKEAAAHDILVVTGAEAERVAAIAQIEGAATVHNEQWAAGEMLSSLQTAVRQLPADRAAVLVMLADQPMVTAPVIDVLLDTYARGEGLIIAPEYGGRRGNPVLIDRSHFEELLALSSGAPRDLLRRHLVTLVPVPTAAVLQDIDDLESYQRHRPK